MLRPLLFSAATVAVAVIAACSSDATPAANSSSSSSSSSGGSKSSSSGNQSSTSSSGTTPLTDAGGPSSGISDQVNLETVNLTVSGNPRNYILVTPKNYDASKAYPLIVALHGDGEAAADFVGFSKLSLATTDQAILAFTDQVIDLDTDYADNPDQMLVEATINDAKSKKNIDANKVWGFGYSKGAFELNEFGCRKPGLFKAYASHAGGAPQEQSADGNHVECPNAIAAPWFVTMGGADDPGGGQFEVDYWASLASCNGDQDTTATTPTNCVKFNGCNAADPIIYCTIPNQPHFPLYDNAAIDSWNWLKTL